MLLALLLKRRLFGPLSYSDVALPVIFLSLEQYETLLNVPNPAPYAYPLLLIMLYCVALLCRNRLLRYALVLTLNFLLIYTGYGLVMGVVTLASFCSSAIGAGVRRRPFPSRRLSPDSRSRSFPSRLSSCTTDSFPGWAALGPLPLRCCDIPSSWR